MRNINHIFPLRFLILLALISILALSGESEAKDPEWSFGIPSGSYTYKAELSADGRYINIPKNCITEIKFLKDDIKGVIK